MLAGVGVLISIGFDLGGKLNLIVRQLEEPARYCSTATVSASRADRVPG